MGNTKVKFLTHWGIYSETAIILSREGPCSGNNQASMIADILSRPVSASKSLVFMFDELRLKTLWAFKTHSLGMDSSDKSWFNSMFHLAI